jgi:hypothetical protein
VLKIEEGDTTSSVATFAGAVSGTDYTIATNAYTSTPTRTSGRSTSIPAPASVTCASRLSPQTTMVIGGIAFCSRGEKAPTTSARPARSTPSTSKIQFPARQPERSSALIGGDAGPPVASRQRKP